MRDELPPGVSLLAGVPCPSAEPWPPFAPLALDFLSALSGAVRAGAAGQQELAAFGFWCRRAHLAALQKRHASPLPRLGRGLILHLAPSNVPAMFGYSLAIGLLAGNANILRLSSRRGGIEQALCEIIAQTLDRPEFAAVKARTALVAYERDNRITQALLAGCDGRVVWGGDATVQAVRSLPMPAHAVELCFADRWSLALLSQRAVAELGEDALADWAHRFYNDTYLMDQNACSSPQLVLWLEDGGTPEVRRRWWQALGREAAARYTLDGYKAARRYERFCLAALDGQPLAPAGLTQYQNGLVLVARLARLSPAMADYKGGYGLFFEGGLQSPQELVPLLSARVQTIVCGGVEPARLAAILAEGRARGGDRVVTLGQALEMDTVWDGRDLIAELSRCIG